MQRADAGSVKIVELGIISRINQVNETAQT
jgi:hypothetical protein